MTTELHERLADLASVTPATSPPPDLWARGVRRRRVVAAGRTAVVAVLVLMIGLGGWAWQQTRPVEPADTHGTPHLPDRFYTPSPWLPSFDGPPGPLVAIGIGTQESLLHSRQRVYAVTAVGGRYGFVELPGFVDGVTADGPACALSPDGRFIAYWETGSPSGTAFSGSFNAPVVGIGVFDALTGGTRSARFPSTHGLDPQGLAWSDAHTLVISFAQIEDERAGDYTSVSNPPQVWRLEDPRPTSLDLPRGETFGDNAPGPGFVVSDGTSVVWPRHRSRDFHFRAPTGTSTPLVAVSPEGDRVASVPGARSPNRLRIGRIPLTAGHQVTRSAMTPVGAKQSYFAPVAWTDERHVVAAVRAPTSEGPPGIRLDLVDVKSGVSRMLISRFDAGFHSLSLASDLLTAPSEPASAPSRPMDRRWLLGGSLVVLLVVGLYLWGATRGRRA